MDAEIAVWVTRGSNPDSVMNKTPEVTSRMVLRYLETYETNFRPAWKATYNHCSESLRKILKNTTTRQKADEPIPSWVRLRKEAASIQAITNKVEEESTKQWAFIKRAVQQKPDAGKSEEKPKLKLKNSGPQVGAVFDDGKELGKARQRHTIILEQVTDDSFRTDNNFAQAFMHTRQQWLNKSSLNPDKKETSATEADEEEDDEATREMFGHLFKQQKRRKRKSTHQNKADAKTEEKTKSLMEESMQHARNKLNAWKQEWKQEQAKVSLEEQSTDDSVLWTSTLSPPLMAMSWKKKSENPSRDHVQRIQSPNSSPTLVPRKRVGFAAEVSSNVQEDRRDEQEPRDFNAAHAIGLAAACAIAAAYAAELVAHAAKLAYASAYLDLIAGPKLRNTININTSWTVAQIAAKFLKKGKELKQMVKETVQITPCTIYSNQEEAIEHSHSCAMPTESSKSPHRRDHHENSSQKQSFLRSNRKKHSNSPSFGGIVHRADSTKPHFAMSGQHLRENGSPSLSPTRKPHKPAPPKTPQNTTTTGVQRSAQKQHRLKAPTLYEGSYDPAVSKLSIADGRFPPYGFSFDVRKVQGGREAWVDHFETVPVFFPKEPLEVNTEQRGDMQNTNETHENTKTTTMPCILADSSTDMIYADFKLLQTKAKQFYPSDSKSTAMNDVLTDSEATTCSVFQSSTEFGDDFPGNSINDSSMLMPMFCANRLQSQLKQPESQPGTLSNDLLNDEQRCTHLNRQVLRKRCEGMLHRRKMSKKRDTLFKNAIPPVDARSSLQGVLEEFAPFDAKNKGRVTVQMHRPQCRSPERTILARIFSEHHSAESCPRQSSKDQQWSTVQRQAPQNVWLAQD